jgi:hypothetical protein
MQYDCVAVRIFYRQPVAIPIGVVRRYRSDAERFDPGAHFEPRILLQIKHEQLLARWAWGRGSFPFVRKLEMESEFGTAEHDAVETFVFDECGNSLERKYVLVERGYLGKAFHGTSDTQVLNLHAILRSLAPRASSFGRYELLPAVVFENIAASPPSGAVR